MKGLFKWIKKYFIPHEHNDYKPHFLRYESTLFVFLVIIIIEVAFLAQVFIVFDKTSFLASVLPGVLTTLTNEERAQNDANPLRQNALLTKAAQLKAQDMANNGYFAHTSPDGKTPWYWLNQVGYNYSMAGENLAVNFFESRDVAEAWMNSPTHRANIVKKNYTEIGIGVASGVYEGSNTVFVAQFFGTPVITQAPPTKPIVTTPVKPTPKPQTPTRTNPATPKTNPSVLPTSVAIAPTTVQVLGEETASAGAVQTPTIFSSMKMFVEKILSSPREYVTYIFVGIILLFVLALLLAIFIKIERQHPVIIMRGVTTIAIILVLTFVNIKLLNTKTKLPSDDMSASVLAH